MKFVVTGLPRSRTKWASAFLSTPDCACSHNNPKPDYTAAGALCDPSALLSWRDIPEDMPIAYIHRPLDEVIAALAQIPMPADLVALLAREAAAMTAARDVLIVNFHHLDARKLWKHCHGGKVSDAYIKVYKDMNIRQQRVEDLRRVA